MNGRTLYQTSQIPLNSMLFQITSAFDFFVPHVSFADILNFPIPRSAIFPSSSYCQFLKWVSYVYARASTHSRFNPLHICLLEPSYYWHYSLNITTCLFKFNNLFSVCVLLNLSNSLDSLDL